MEQKFLVYIFYLLLCYDARRCCFSLKRKATPFCIGKETYMYQKSSVYSLVLSSMFLALALVLPFFTGQIKEIGSMLCPMHIPVLLCGFFCGWKWGLVTGFIAPILRSALFGMPVMFPMAICMAFELATYGAISGLLYRILPPKKSSVYVSLLTAMVCGRLVWGAARFLATGADVTQFGLSAFWAGAVTSAIPGIIIQIILIPILVISLNNKSFSR